MSDAIDAALLDIVGHLHAAQVQRAASDDRIIAEHIDAALALARQVRRTRSDEKIIAAHLEGIRGDLRKITERAS
jgi:hypothetical protein